MISPTDCVGSFTINGPDDVAKLNQCGTFDGNITVAATGTTDIALDGLKNITGSMRIADSDTVLSLSSSTLERISTLSLYNLPNLSTLRLPALGNITKLEMQGLYSLKGCEIATQGLKHDIKEISIIGTAIENMDWLKWPISTHPALSQVVRLWAGSRQWGQQRKKLKKLIANFRLRIGEY